MSHGRRLAAASLSWVPLTYGVRPEDDETIERSERADKAPAGTHEPMRPRLTVPTDARDADTTRPSAAYLRHLIRTLIGDTTTSVEVRKECDKLMLAISANNLADITDRLAELRRLADAEGLQLPGARREPSRRD